MGEVADRLSGEIKTAMKARDRTRLATMRLLATAVRNREVELRREVTEADFLELVGREVKRRKEAAEAYDRGGRADRAEEERAEQGILESFLPRQLSEEEVGAAIEEAITATGASGPQEVGKVMGWIMGRHKGRVDGAHVNRLARDRLSGG